MLPCTYSYIHTYIHVADKSSNVEYLNWEYTHNQVKTQGNNVAIHVAEKSSGVKYLEGLAAAALGHEAFRGSTGLQRTPGATRRLECGDLDTAEYLVSSINACKLANR
jgi:hypothetical protein